MTGSWIWPGGDTDEVYVRRLGGFVHTSINIFTVRNNTINVVHDNAVTNTSGGGSLGPLSGTSATIAVAAAVDPARSAVIATALTTNYTNQPSGARAYTLDSDGDQVNWTVARAGDDQEPAVQVIEFPAVSDTVWGGGQATEYQRWQLSDRDELAVNLSRGTVRYTGRDVAINGTGLALAVTRMWDSVQGWTSNLDARVVPFSGDGDVAVYNEAANRSCSGPMGPAGSSPPPISTPPSPNPAPVFSSCARTGPRWSGGSIPPPPADLPRCWSPSRTATTTRSPTPGPAERPPRC